MKKIKKGFTLVELLVVIAIISILASVSVVGYLGFSEKAKNSNDEVLVKQLNTILESQSVINKPKNMQEVVSILEENSFEISDLKPTSSKNEFVWNMQTNQFEILKVANISNYNDSNLWIVARNSDEIEEYTKNISIYASSDYEGENNIIVNHGFDAGINTNFNMITYQNSVVDSYIKTNGGYLVIDGNSTISHDGLISKVIINESSDITYNEYGTVLGSIELNSGKLVIENNSIVDQVIVSNQDIRITNYSDKSFSILALENIISNLDNLIESKLNYSKLPITSDLLDKSRNFSGGIGSLNYPFLIYNEVQFQKLKSGSKENLIYYKLINNIDFSISNLNQEILLENKIEYIVLDGAKYNIILNTNPISTYFFKELNNSTIKNVNLYYTGTNSLVEDAANNIYDSINFYGMLRTTSSNHGLLGYNVSEKIEVINCNNYCEIISNCTYTSIFLGNVVNKSEIIFTNCSNYAYCKGESFSLFVANAEAMYELNITNCKNNHFIDLEGTTKWTEMVANFNDYLTNLVVDNEVWVEDSIKVVGIFKDNYFGNFKQQ